MVLLEKVFEPLAIKGIQLRNRIVCLPINTNLGTSEGFPTERLISFYERRARGGVGLTIVGATAVAADGRVTTRGLRLDQDKYIPHLRSLFSAIKEGGSLAAIQLIHSGKLRHSKRPTEPPAPLPQPSAILKSEPRDFTVSQVEHLEDAFAEAARRAKEAGADMVEFHGAHHYLINQFLSPYFNEREDIYGGSPENRLRFFKNILRKTRERVGEDYPLICRINGADFLQGGLSPADSSAMASELAMAGVDVFDVSAGGREEGIQRTIPGEDLGEGPNLYLAEAVKQAANATPIIGVGNIWDLSFAEKVIKRGQADLVGMARALIADPEIVNKSRAGDFGAIISCSHCANCCYWRFAKPEVACSMGENL